MKLFNLNWLAMAALLITPGYAQDSGIGYATVEEAHAALELDANAVLTSYEGWDVFNQKGEGRYFLWSFTPVIHPANPTVIRREVIAVGGTLSINMNALCEAPREVCDILMEQFKEINQTIINKYSGG